MIKMVKNSVIRIISEDQVYEREDIILQIEPIDYVYYNGLKQFSKTMFLCELKEVN